MQYQKADTEDFLQRLSPQDEASFVEAMFLVANADGHVSQVETDEVCRSIEAVTSGRMRAGRAIELMQSARTALASSDQACRLRALSLSLRESRRHHVLVLAAQVAAVEAGIAPEERRVLLALASAFDIPASVAEAVFEAVS